MLLDTTVVAEPLRAVPDAKVMRWLNDQALETCYVAAPSIGELLREIEKLPAARRKSAYGIGVAEAILHMFDRRVLAFDLMAARAYAQVVVNVRKCGMGISRQNAQVAAIALATNMPVVTADSAPFVAAGCHVVDPWF